VAVPPADDGELTTRAGADDPSGAAEPAAESRTDRVARTRRALVAGTAVLAVLVVACVVLLGLRYARDTDPDRGAGARALSLVSPGDAANEQASREAVMRQARQFTLRLFTYGPDDLEDGELPGYVKGVEELSTPKFAVDFEEGSQIAVQTVAQARYGRSAEVSLIGVRELSDDAARVMVAGSFTSSYPPANEGEPRQQTQAVPLRLEVALVRTQGKWLVDDIIPVTSSDPDATGGTEPGAGATGGATPTAPASPGAGQRQQGQGQGQQGQGQQGQGQQGQQGQGQQGQGQGQGQQGQQGQGGGQQ